MEYIESSKATPIAWKWPCPVCTLVTVIRAVRGGGVEALTPCPHFLLAKAESNHLDVKYAPDQE
jgi:hypothetical protein